MSDETEQTVTCENCGRDIPESKSFLHESYCIRNVIRCPKCNEPVDKSEMEEHNNENHKFGACKHCKKEMEKRLLEEHEGSCHQKPKMCQYCNCEVTTEEFSQHVYRCGSRTKKCPFCNKNILVRDYDDHEPVCQVNHENYGENFPAMQEEKKETSNPYSGLSSKYMPSATPSSNPYESLNQAPKSRTKESSSSKHESQPKRSTAAEEPKASSKPDLKNPALSKVSSSSSKPQESVPKISTSSSRPQESIPKTSSSSKPQESSSYNYPKHREEKTSTTTTTGPSISSKYSAPDSKYGVPDTKIPSVLDNHKPYSYPKEDPTAGYKPYSREDSYKAGAYGARSNDITSYTAATSENTRTGAPTYPTSQTTAPTTKYTATSYLDNLATRGQPDSLNKGPSSYGTGITGIGSTGVGSTGIGSSNRPKIGESYGTTGNYGYNAADSSKTKAANAPTSQKYDPFSKAGQDSINKYSRPEDLKPSVSSQNRVPTAEKTYLRGDPSKGTSGTSYSKASDYSKPDDKKQFLSDFQRGAENTNYTASRSNQPPTTGFTSGVTGHSSNLNKKYEAPKYEDTTKKASKLTDFSSKPTIDSRTQASKADPRSYEKKESSGSRPSGVSSHKTSGTRDTGVSSHTSQSRKHAPTQNIPSYNPSDYMNEVYEDDHGINQDPQLQKAIQESLRAGQRSGQSGQSRRNVDVNQSIDDPDLARAIQESLQSYGQR